MSLAILNENYSQLEGPRLLHQLIEWRRKTCALDFLRPNGQRTQYSYHELRKCVLSVASLVGDTLRTESKGFQIIPILIPQSPGLYISILAILEANAAFCPISLDSPLDRIQFVVGDVSAKVVITTREYQHLATWEGGPRVIIVEEHPAIPRHDDFPEIVSSKLGQADDLAYVMYTSGSSGTPKGVAVSHLSASQSLLAHERHIPPFRRFLQFAAPSFDVSVFEIFFPLYRGATLVSCSRVEMLNDLTGTVNRLEVDGMELTPTVVSSLLQKRSNVPGLKVLLTIGEMLTKPVVSEFGKSSDHEGILYAMYGPTEAAIHCIVNPQMKSDANCIDIGTPFETVSAFIVSAEAANQERDIRILQVGETGELVIGGPQVARCYLNRTELNEEVFVKVRGQRAYRTGDKARITSAGSIEILGRMTSGQVKLRGQRVELGEVEDAAYRHPGVQVAVSSIMNGVLVVFVLTQDPEMGSEDLLKTSSSWLPTYMLPNEFIILNKFPYMQSGKVDKSKLEADLERVHLEAGNEPELWNSATEDLVAQTIGEVLGTEVRSTTRLAGIGLDSLVAIRLVSTLRSSGVEISVVDILKAENVSALAKACKLSSVKDKLTDSDVAAPANAENLIQKWSERSQEPVCLDEIECIWPCTPLQDAMISETVIETGSYKNRILLELSATVDVEKTRSAIQLLAHKNPILRTGFIPLMSSHSSFCQLVRKNLAFSQIEVVEEFHDDVASLQGLSLLHPMRIQIRHKNHRNQVLLHIHHAIYDAWSLELLLDDLNNILLDKPCQERQSFSSVVEWYWKENSSDNNWTSKRYWEDHLNQLEISKLPCLTTVNVERELCVAYLQTSIDTKLIMTKRQGLSVSAQSIFQAAFAFILSSYIGSDDVCFGTVFSGRTVPIDGIENIVGPCLATLPVRLDLLTVSTMGEMLQQLNSINRKHLEHSSLPLRHIKRASGVEPGQTLFDSLLVWQQTLHSFDHKRDQVMLVDSADFLEFNLTIEIIPQEGQIMLKANYQSAILPLGQVDLLLRQLEQLVAIAIKSPEATLSAARECLSENLLSMGNPYPEVDIELKTLTSTIEDLALNHPERTAIRFAKSIEVNAVDIQEVSYHELNLKANQLAHHLISCRVLLDDLVCVYMDKSVELYIWILAIIKSGAGYIAITPDTPLDRVRHILFQSNAKVVICQSSLGKAVGAITSTPLVLIDELDHSILGLENPDLKFKSENLAYCVFTSGSTGAPKGVLVTRGNLMSNIKVLSELYPNSGSHLLSDGMNLLQSCSQAFDVSVFEIFFTWNVGACLCSAIKDVLFRNIELAINALQVTHLSLTPTVAALISPKNVPKVKFLVTAGEAVTERVFNEWADDGLWQGYGPSETTNICTLRPNVKKNNCINNIGPPLKNTSVFILHPEDAFSLIPRGGEGEFCFGGAQVGRGYLDATQSVGKFIEHPRYGRLYRSGDYGRLLYDGSLSFSGRKDGQIKLRGQRIELGEINNLLLRSPDVRDCVTLVIGGRGQADRRLVNFFTPRQSSNLEFHSYEMDCSLTEKLLSSLRAALPLYMVPSALVSVSCMPSTAQGKIDSRRLVQHYHSLPIARLANSTYKRIPDVEPQWSRMEEKIAQIVARAANVPRESIGPETSFFSLGIDSVSAISLARALRGDLGLNLQISDILKYASVSRLANRAPQVRNTESVSHSPESDGLGLDPRSLSLAAHDFARDGRVIDRISPCTPLQEAMLSIAENSSHDSYKNRLVLQIEVSKDSFKHAWAQMVERHEILRTYFIRTDHPQHAYAQIVLREMVPCWESQKKTTNSHIAIAGTATSEYELPYAIEFRDLPDSTQVVLSLHHAIHDAVALSILFEEIEIVLQNGDLRSPVSFAPFLKYISMLSLAEAGAYWDRLLGGFTPIEILAETAAPPTAQNFVTRMNSGSSLSWIENQVKAYSSSLLSICQAAWISLLSIHLQRNDICIGNVVSGRTIPIDDLDRLVAPCFNTIPVRVKDVHNLSFLEVFRELHSQNIDSMPFQLTPLRRIQSRLKTDGIRLFDTLLILQQPVRPLNASIWSLLEDEGVMDIPIVIEIIPQRDNDNLGIILHSRRDLLTDEDAILLLKSFDSILRISLTNPRHRIASAFTRGESNVLVRGKIISRPDPQHSKSSHSKSMSATEAKILEVLVLFTSIPRDKIGLRTSIYRLGLDSINVVQVAARLRKDGIQVIASDLLQHPNIERLALHLAGKHEHPRMALNLFDFESFHRKHYMNIQRELGTSQDITIRPCTLVQCGMLAQTLHTDGMQYVNNFVLELEPDVSLAKMRRAWSFAVQQHEILRTGFVEIDDPKYPFAMVTYASDQFALPWSEFVESRNDWETVNAKSLASRPWTLDVSCTSTIPRIKFTAHHAIYDAQSLELILSDVANHYYSASSQSPLKQSPINSVLSAILDAADQHIETREAFWQESNITVSHFPNLTPLHAPSQEILVAEICSKFSILQLEELCRQREVSLLAAGQTAWGRLLSAYVGSPSVTFGVTLSGHSILEDLDYIAFPTIITLPIICNIMGTNAEILSRTMHYNSQLHEHQFTPLTSIQKWTGNLSGKLFDTLLTYQKIEAPENATRRPWRIVHEEGRVEYGLSIELQPTESGLLQLRLTYKTDLIPVEQANILLHQLDELLLDTLQNPDGTCAQLASLDKDLLSIIPSAEPTLPTQVQLLHQFVEMQVEMFPNQMALEFTESFSPESRGPSVWSFQQLNWEGNKVATLLLDRGAKVGDLVGISFDKCPEASFTILGILKAGCAFVAIDPSAPPDRIKFIVADSGVSLIFTSGDLTKNFEEMFGTRSKIEVIDAGELDPALLSDSPSLQREIRPEDTCYCLYTSGTTGTPKGCEITHENAVQAMMSFTKLFDGHWTKKSKWLQFASFHFDVSILEQFWPWSVGICVASAPRDLLFQDMSEAIRRLGITHIDLTPSLARLLRPEDVPCLKKGVFITGGEQLKQEILDVWGKHGCIYNGYGPTETTIGVTMYPRVPTNGKPSNIGSQFLNVGSYVFKTGTTQPVLRGAVGELCVSGKLVGKGYLNRPELTKERFPYLDASGERVYRTGDLVRVLYDNNFLFLGRVDDQVKLRGQRLELGEINESIKRHVEGLQDVVTLVVRHKNQQKEQLVTFFVLSPTIQKNPPANRYTSRIREACKRSLPGYMVPTYVIRLDRLPLSANNKVEYKLLAKQFSDMSVSDLKSLETAAQSNREWTTQEQAVLESLGKILNVDKEELASGGNVFEFGIDSISVIAFTRNLRRFGYKRATLSVVMQNTPIDSLVGALSSHHVGIDGINHHEALIASQKITAFARRNIIAVATQLKMSPSEIECLAPCTPAQEGMVFRFLSDSRALYFTTFQFDLDESIEETRLRAAFGIVARHLQILRTKLVLTKDGCAQVVLKDTDTNWQSNDLQHSDNKACNEDRFQEIADIEKSEALANPWRVIITKNFSKRKLSMIIFHGLYDGISLPMMLHLIYQQYHSLSSIEWGAPFHSVLPYGPLAPLNDAQSFWKEALGGWTDCLIPKIVGQFQEQRSRTSNVIAGSGRSESIRQKLGVTYQALLQAAFCIVLQEFIGPNITFGLVNSGRAIDFDGAETVVGPMLNTVPFHMALTANVTWQELIRACHTFNMRMLPYQHTALKDIQNWCNAGKPLFDVLFVFQQENSSAFNVEGFWEALPTDTIIDFPLALEAQLLSDGTITSKFVGQADFLDEKSAIYLQGRFESALCAMRHLEETALLPSSQSVKRSFTPAEGDSRVNQPQSKDQTPVFTWTTAAEQFRKEIASLAGTDDIDERTSIFELGLDSIDMIKLASRLQVRGIHVTVTSLLKSQTIENMQHEVSLIPQSSKEPTDTILDYEHHLTDHLLSMEKLTAEIVTVLPATPLQEGIVTEMIISDYTRYFNHEVFSVSSHVDIGKLEGAWNTVISNNAIFRTQFIEIDSVKFPMSFAQAIIRPRESYWSGAPATATAKLDAIIGDVIQGAIEEAMMGNLLQLRRINHQRDRYFVLSISHALYDGWSLQALHQDVWKAYDGEVVMRPDPRPTLENIFNAGQPDEVSFWKASLANLQKSKFPESRHSNSVQNVVHRREKVSSYSWEEIQRFSKAAGASIETIGLTAWTFVLATLLRRLDIVFGMVLSCRDSAETNELMYPLMNTVAIRPVIHGSIAEMLQHMQDYGASVKNYQYFPLRKAQALAGIHDGNLFDSLFIYQGRNRALLPERHRLYESLSSVSDLEFAVCIELGVVKNGLIWRAACKDSVLSDSETQSLLDEMDVVLGKMIHEPTRPTIAVSSNGVSICGLEPFHEDSMTANEQHHPVETSNSSIAWTDRNRIFGNVLAEVARCPREDINKDQTLFHLGLDSISAIKVSSILKRNGINLTVSEMTGNNIQGMIDIINKNSSKSVYSHDDGYIWRYLESIMEDVNRDEIIHSVGLDSSDVEDVLPVTAGQTYMIARSQLSSGTLFASRFTFKVKNEFDLPTLENARRALIKANPILRTVFVMIRTNKPLAVQIVKKDHDHNSILEVTCPQAGVLSLSTPITLSTEKRGGDNLVHLDIHHALYDGVSLPLLLHHLQQLCAQPHNVLPVETRFRRFAARSIHRDAEGVDSLPNFWTNYLTKNAILHSKYDMNSSNGSNVEVFEPANPIGILGLCAQEAGVSVDAILLAAFSKVYSKLLQLRDGVLPTEARDAIFGMYLANRAPYGEDLSTLIAPTLNILPIRICTSGSLIEIARAVQSDLRHLSGANIVGTSLAEIYEWTGVQVNCFVNILKSVQDAPLAANTEFELKHVDGAGQRRAEIVSRRGDDELRVKAEKCLGEARNAYLPSVDIEMRVTNSDVVTWLDIGVFAPCEYLNIEDAREVIEEIKVQLRSLG